MLDGTCQWPLRSQMRAATFPYHRCCGSFWTTSRGRLAGFPCHKTTIVATLLWFCGSLHSRCEFNSEPGDFREALVCVSESVPNLFPSPKFYHNILRKQIKKINIKKYLNSINPTYKGSKCAKQENILLIKIFSYSINYWNKFRKFFD